MKNNGKFRADIILIGALLLAGAVIAGVLLLGSRSGGTVVVKVDGVTECTFDLNGNTEYTIEGAEGGKNILRIEGGEAWIEEADCPDGLCRNMGRINRAGQSLVCLPHKVVVEITDDDSSSEPEVDVYVK